LGGFAFPPVESREALFVPPAGAAPFSAAGGGAAPFSATGGGAAAFFAAEDFAEGLGGSLAEGSGGGALLSAEAPAAALPLARESGGCFGDEPGAALAEDVRPCLAELRAFLAEVRTPFDEFRDFRPSPISGGSEPVSEGVSESSTTRGGRFAAGADFAPGGAGLAAGTDFAVGEAAAAVAEFAPGFAGEAGPGSPGLVAAGLLFVLGLLLASGAGGAPLALAVLFGSLSVGDDMMGSDRRLIGYRIKSLELGV